MKGEHHLHLIHQSYHLVANGPVISGKEAVLQWEVDHHRKTIAVIYTWEEGEMIGGLDEVHISCVEMIMFELCLLVSKGKTTQIFS